MITSDFERGSLAHAPPVEEEPQGPVEDTIGVLADAEAIVDAAIPDVVADIDRERAPWWKRFRRRRPDGGGDDFRLSNR
jgi:hypothetical protein